MSGTLSLFGWASFSALAGFLDIGREDNMKYGTFANDAWLCS
jgi:hypothetical protein